MDEVSFTDLLQMSPDDLLLQYATTAQTLSQLYSEIAYQRICELRDKTTDKTVRMDIEGRRDQLIERKFLIARILDHGQPRPL